MSENNRSLPLENIREDKLDLLFPSSEPLPEERLLGQEIREQIWTAVGNLPAEQRAVIVLKYYLGLSIEEISAEVISPKGTVKWRLHKARQRLRGLLRHLDRNEIKPNGAPAKSYRQGKVEGILEPGGTTEEVDG